MIGQTVSHYRIVEKLGEGGMGIVYKADDTKLHRAVALKFLAPDKTRDVEAKKRFMQEARAASALDHPNIAVVHEIDETDDGRSFICMAYYPGETLKEKIERGPLPIEQSVRLAMQVADGLERAHGAGIVHRDIKPANVIVTDRGEAKIVDFGIAKLAGQTRASKEGPTAGTAAYMSPEQALGGKVDHRSDLFSLGIVLYEMVTGKRPFLAEHESALLYTIVNVDPAPPSTLRADLSQQLEQVILRLLQKDPAKRYQNAAEALSALKQSIGLTEPTRRPTARPQFLTIRNLALPFSIAIVALLFFVTPIRDTIERWLGIGSGSIPKHLVVLPFTNVGNDSTNQAFCDGFMETLTSKLTQMQGVQESFWVVASSEVRQRRISSPGGALQAFGATLAITGSVQREDNAFRVTLNLVDTKTSHQLGKSIVLDSRATALFKLQDDTMIKIAEMLDVKLQPQELRVLTAGGTTDPTAYDFYLQARGHLQRYEKLENINTAIGLFERALKEDSTYALAYAGLGEAYWRKYDATKDPQWIQSAVQYCMRALELNDQLAPVHITLGLVRTRTGHYEEALQEYKLALVLDSLNSDAYRELAETYAKLNDFEKAEGTYNKAISLRPSYWAGHYYLARFYLTRKLYSQAEGEFRRVVEITPDNALGYNGVGAVLFQLGRYDEARTMFERSLSIEPNYYVYSNLATILFYQGRYADLARTYEKALAVNDRDYIVWGNLASAYHWTGEREKARLTFERAVQKAEELHTVNPRDVTVLSHLADYYSMLGKKTEALKLIQQAMRLEPENLGVMKRAVDVYEQIGNRERALKLIELALKRGTLVAEFQRAPALEELRRDVRYLNLVQTSGKNPK